MTYKEDIISEEDNIRRLQETGRRLIIPRKSIAWQFQNIGNVRNIHQNILITRRNRRAIAEQIKASQTKVVSLREALAKSLELVE